MNRNFHLIFTLTAALIFGLPAIAGAQTANYIVQFEDPPLALFTGSEIRGVNLEPTNPQARRAAGLDATLRLQSRSPASRAYLALLDGRHGVFLAAIGQRLGRAPDVLFRYRAAFNGVALALTAEEAARISKLPGVKRVEEEVIYHINTDRGPTFIGADNVWNGNLPGGVGSKGEGVVVGVIDTGLNLKNNHPSFAATGGDGFTHTNPLGDGVFRGWCDLDDPNFDPDLQCNAKVIGAYSFTQDNTPDDENGHGSHVASTAAGNVVSDVSIPSTTAQVDVSGVAPHANIIMYEVCSDATGNCPGAALQAALDQIVLDADVVDAANFSIGSDPDNPWTNGLALGFLSARAAGIAVATSAGNSGPGAFTVGSPAVAPWLTAVAAQTHDRFFFDASVSVTGPDTPPASLTDLTAVQGTGPAFGGVVADAIGFDEFNPLGCDPFVAGIFSGQIALLERGGCNFSVKVDNAANVGAVAVVVFNNAAGGAPIVMNGLESTTIPSVMIGNTDGVAIRDWILANSNATADVGPTAIGTAFSPDVGDIMASFSSRGPNAAADEILKPNVSAPGVAIFAAFGNQGSLGDTWGFLNGTSMASPYVAGAMALVRALRPEWTAAEVHSALVLTAQAAETIVKENGATPSDPFDRGAGRVSPAHAVQAGLVLDETPADFTAADPASGGDPTQLNLPDLAHGDCSPECAFTRVVRSTLDEPAEWQVSVDQPERFDVTVEPDNFTVDAGALQELTITAKPLFGESGFLFRFGTVRLTPATPGLSPDLTMPIAVRGENSSSDRPISDPDPDQLEATLETGAGAEETLLLGNPGQLPLEWTIALSDGLACGAAPPSWLQAAPLAGTTEAGSADEITLTIDTTGLAIGEHEAVLCIDSNDPVDPQVTVPIRLTVTELIMEADLAVSLSAASGFVGGGEAIGYTLEVSNVGPRDLTGATIFSALGDGLSDIQWTCEPGTGAACSAFGTGDINQPVDLAVGASLTFQVEAVLADGGADDQILSQVLGIVPEELDDPDQTNNFDEAVIQTGVFADGFE